MGRSVGLEPCLGAKLATIAGRGMGSGVLVGALHGDMYHVVFVAETPSEEEEETEKVSSGLNERALDVGWMVEHATQVQRLLPGGLTILGFFLACPESFLTTNDGKLRKLLEATSNLESGVPKQQLILQSAIVCKVLDEKSSTLKPVELKNLTKPLQWVKVESQLVLDIPQALSTDNDPLSKDIVPVMEKFKEQLKNSSFIFNNKVYADNVVLGKAVEVEKKKGKAKLVEENVEESEDPDVINVELLAKENGDDDVVVVKDTEARMRLAGKLSCRAYLPPGSNVAWARNAVIQDLTRSLNTRMNMHTETMVGDGEPEEKIVHEPPRRVFVSVPDTLLTVCDYLYPGEGVEDCISNVKEIFGWDILEDSIEDDVEIVASPRETRPLPSENESGRTAEKRPISIGYAVAFGMAAISMGLAWLQLNAGKLGEDDSGEGL